VELHEQNRITRSLRAIRTAALKLGVHLDLEPVLQLFTREKQLRAQAEQARQRASFLAEASIVLASSLDYPTTLASVARLAVPHLADWCAVYMLEADGAIRLLAVSHVDPAKIEWAYEMGRHYPPDPQAPHGVPHVLRTGRSEMYSEIPEEVVIAYARDAEHLRLLRELGLKSYMIVPLAARERTFGTIAFAVAQSGRRYGPEDLALAEDLARRAAAAVDNARLYQEAQEAVSARDQFFSIASHELRTPLSPIQLQVQLLLRAVRTGTLDKIPHGRLLEILEICDRQIKQLVHLINDLLDVSRIKAGRLQLHLEEVDLSSLVRDVGKRFESVLAKAGSQVLLRAGTAVIGHWDRLRLEQVVTNLLSNAIKYGLGQPIDITVGSSGRHARLVVTDHGVGIAPGHQARIFDRFERAVSERSYGGLGLGLFIAWQIIDAMGGTIGVESEVGKGSTFTVELPFHPAIAPKGPAANGERGASAPC
jgi:signal transduction histidine kinase